MNNEILRMFEQDLEKIKTDNSYRYFKTIRERRGKLVTYRGRTFLNLSSNDYLGFASDADLVREFYSGLNNGNCIDQYGLGSSSSRLLTGDFPLYDELEKTVALMYSGARPAESASSNMDALVLSSGYHANTGIIPALAGKGDLILSDKLNHASIVDGARLSAADRTVYDHLDYRQAADILSRNRDRYRKILIVSESVFSMDGDIADLRELIELRNRFNAILYIDEAHALGVFGESGLGVCERDGLVGDVDIIIGTFGKALGSIGAFAVTDPIVKDYLVNTVRPFIYTTALPPVIANWNMFAFRMLHKYRKKCSYLLDISRRLRSAISESGFETSGSSHIVPVIFGDSGTTIRAAEMLQEQGFLVFPIRPPSVPKGSSRIRISLRSDISWEDIENIPNILEALGS